MRHRTIRPRHEPRNHSSARARLQPATSTIHAMYISEIFHSIQGEGLLTGVPSVFIRTSGCNLRCRWCDTPYTSWSPEGTERSVDEIMAEIAGFSSRHAVITGGEPMLMKDLPDLTETLGAAGYHVTIETAGTVYTDLRCDLASISPKLSNSTPWTEEDGKYARNHERLRINLAVLGRFMAACPYQLKFVVDRQEDLDEVETLIAELDGVDRTRVLLMPQGRTADELSNRGVWVAEACKSRGFRYCPRVHIDLYGDTRGT